MKLKHVPLIIYSIAFAASVVAIIVCIPYLKTTEETEMPEPTELVIGAKEEPAPSEPEAEEQMQEEESEVSLEPENVPAADTDGHTPVSLEGIVSEILSAEWFAECDEPGEIQYCSYSATDYATGKEITKKAEIYLPYGYSEEECYDVVLLCHGSGGDETYWFNHGKDARGTRVDVKNLLDNMIKKEKCKPVIAVSMSWRNDVTCIPAATDVPQLQRDSYQQGPEIENDLIPWIVENYSTFATASDKDSIIAAREHFGYVGLSWGAMTGVYGVLRDNIDIMANFGILAPSRFGVKDVCKEVDRLGGSYPVRCIMFCAGSNDKSLEKSQYVFEALDSGSSHIADGENAFFFILNDGKHDYGAWAAGLYNYLTAVCTR